MPLHKISDIVHKVNVMYEKSILLHRMKYGGTGVVNGQYDRQAVDALIAEIQQLAGEIYNDREKHPKLKEKDNLNVKLNK